MLKNPIYIESSHLVGYKSIREAAVTFQAGLNIIIGKNGSGKTNLLDFLSVVLNNHIYHTDFDFDSFIIKMIVNEQVVNLAADKKNEKLAIQFNNETFELNLTELENRFLFTSKLINAINTTFRGRKNRLIVFNIPTNKANLFLLEPLSLSIKPNGINKLRTPRPHSFLVVRLFLLFIEEKLKSEQAIDNIKALLPNYFIEFIDKHDVLKNLQKFSPIEDLRISPNINVYPQGFDNELSIQNIYIEFLLNGQWQSWQMLSDGTKRLFYLITEVTLTNGIVLLEEPELGVHPHQLHQIMIFLKEQSEDKQIILTTHSPQVLDVLNSDELDRIIIAEVHKEKGSQFRHLDEKTTAKAKYYLEDEGFLSDFWRYSTLEPREVL